MMIQFTHCFLRYAYIEKYSYKESNCPSDENVPFSTLVKALSRNDLYGIKKNLPQPSETGFQFQAFVWFEIVTILVSINTHLFQINRYSCFKLSPFCSIASRPVSR